MSNVNNTVLYVGVTNNIERRVREHYNKVNEGFTNKYNAGKLVYYETYHDIKIAIRREKQLKGWTRAKKNALIDSINPNRDDLSESWMK